MAINPTGRQGSLQLNTGTTSTRRTPRTDFGTQMRNGIAAGAGAVGGAVGVAAPFVPGAAVVSAAISGGAQQISGGGGGGAGVTGSSGFAGKGDIPGTGSLLNGDTSGGSNKVTGDGSQQDLLNQTKNMQELAQSFNLQYLQLQEKTQNENRQFSTISNVMKNKHDTAKSSISNVR